jgi:hypothetical protein
MAQIPSKFMPIYILNMMIVLVLSHLAKILYIVPVQWILPCNKPTAIWVWTSQSIHK